MSNSFEGIIHKIHVLNQNKSTIADSLKRTEFHINSYEVIILDNLTPNVNPGIANELKYTDFVVKQTKDHKFLKI